MNPSSPTRRPGRMARWRRRALGLLAASAALPCMLAQAAPVQWTVESGGNGHWYEYVPAISIFAPVSFDAARSDALSRTHLGLTGHLVTVTSAAEQAFIQNFPFLIGFGAVGDAWLGASDAAEEGVWRWLDGPEAGQLVDYSNWLPGQPTSGPAWEDYDYLTLLINVSGGAPIYGWASKPATGAFGYLVEYSANAPDPDPDPDPDPQPLPTPGTAALLALGLGAVAGTTRRRRLRG